ncbi:sirohydrochlorin chelatase [Streptomyces palmae]|uniref:sirohydrochlorin chelatase n=1 Tax=Streptomyces palmae TaxID=1701085 RepID=UPI001FD787FA|nr:CbiX/SirB N-terminal domain-containing protein [Streptomyces palmae]
MLLLVAHGSRDPRHAATVASLAERVRWLRPGVRVETAFLDFTAPRVPRVLERLAAEEAGPVVAVPLLLTRAFHARSDIPAVLRAAGARHPGLTIRQAAVLGPSPLLRAALERRLYEAGVRPGDRPSTGVVLACAGTTDPEAVAVIEGVARRWRRTGWHAVRPAFASAVRAGGPLSTEDAVRALRAAGCARVAVAPYAIAPGRLPDRIAAGAAAAGAEVLAEVLGAAPEVARLLVRRYAAAAPQPAMPAV